MPFWAWFSAAALLSAAEMLGGEFVLLLLGGAALIAGGSAFFIEPFWLQLLVFALSAITLLLVVRPPLVRALHRSDPQHRTGMEAVIGSQAMVISTVDAAGGQVKIGGEIWTARGVEGHRPLPPGSEVTVVEVRGATAVVIWGPR